MQKITTKKLIIHYHKICSSFVLKSDFFDHTMGKGVTAPKKSVPSSLSAGSGSSSSSSVPGSVEAANQPSKLMSANVLPEEEVRETTTFPPFCKLQNFP